MLPFCFGEEKKKDLLYVQNFELTVLGKA